MDSILEKNMAWVNDAWCNTANKLRKNCDLLRGKLPAFTIDGVYDDRTDGDIGAWTNGFWPGILWMMYVATGEESFREVAEECENKLDMALENYEWLHHDVGFMWHISSGANYRITGNAKSKNRNLHAASTLAARYNVQSKIIRAWNVPDEAAGWSIIDSMMNIPLLYWASKETGNIAFYQIAVNHADTVLKHFIRPDGSVYHIMNFDVHTGEFKGAAPRTQGYESESSWSRGQSWAIYGFVLSYIHTGEQRFLDAAKKVAHYFIAAVCNDGYIPKSDFRAPEEPIVLDSSAGAIAACGLIEIAKVVPEYEKKLYIQAALNIVKALTDKQCDWSDKQQGILQNSSGCYYKDVHKSYIFGDYYYVEALYKLKGFGPMFW